jgi:biotin carboxylase
VSVVPVTDYPLASASAAIDRSRRMGYPVILKASYGGGGGGWRVAGN